jgi:hypothetical protein
MAPYIDILTSERTEMAERIDATAILCGATDPEVVYPSDAMSQVLTGRFTQGYIDSYKANPRYYETRILWNFDLYYPTCLVNDPTHLTSIWDCADCPPSFMVNVYCAERRRDHSNPFDWGSRYPSYKLVREDRTLEPYVNEVKSHQNENTESWMTTTFTSWTPHTQRVTFAKRCVWTCTNAPADADFE